MYLKKRINPLSSNAVFASSGSPIWSAYILGATLKNVSQSG
jgi:hypothetical protein